MPLQRCLCHLLRQNYTVQRLTRIRLASTAAASPTAFENKLVRLAERRLKQASTTAQSLSTGYGADVEAVKRVKQLEGLRDALKQFKKCSELCMSLQDVIDNDPDNEMRELARIDISDSQESLSKALITLQTALMPLSSTDELGCLVEIKSGVGGGEASIFAADLLRMYSRFADAKGWKSEVINAASVSAGPGDTEAYREVTLDIDSEGAYAYLKHEAGVHRVQRVPATESQGRVHTSTASVIVLPSATGNNATLDSVLDERDVKVEVMRSGGAGGQHVNRTESAVRLTHLPSGITVSMQDTRSQHKNRAKAFQILRARLLALQLAEQQATDRSARRLQVRTQDRSEKIRTYNYAQDRITDHRLPLTLNGIEGYLNGGDGKLEYMSDQVNQWSLRQQLDELLAAEV